MTVMLSRRLHSVMTEVFKSGGEGGGGGGGAASEAGTSQAGRAASNQKLQEG